MAAVPTQAALARVSREGPSGGVVRDVGDGSVGALGRGEVGSVVTCLPPARIRFGVVGAHDLANYWPLGLVAAWIS